MSLREVEGPAGAPWERPMHGTLDRLEPLAGLGGVDVGAGAV